MGRFATTALEKVIRSIAPSEIAQLSDRELLHRFGEEDDESAFSELVSRHGNMVLGICKRALWNIQDAEDSTQATFLILAQKAKSERWHLSIANWLYTTARRVAHRSLLSSKRRKCRESKVAVPETIHPIDGMSGRELLTILDEELDKLPGRYREPLVLCYLQGLTRDEAAKRLDVPLATIKTQLERARKRLCEALKKRDCALGAGLLTLAVTSSSGASSTTLVERILATVLAMPSSTVVTLAKEVAMKGFWNKCLTFSLILGIGIAMIAYGWQSLGLQAIEQQKSQTKSSELKTDAVEQSQSNAIAGQVLSPDGKPFAKASIYLFSRKRLGKEFKNQLVTTTDEKGQFTYDPSQHTIGFDYLTLVAIADGFTPDWITLNSSTNQVTLRLVKEVPIRGKLVDLEGKPIKGARVELVSVGSASKEHIDSIVNAMRLNPEWVSIPKQIIPFAKAFQLETRTDDKGNFELRGVGTDRIATLRTTSPGLEVCRVYVITREGFDAKDVLPKLNELEIVKRGFNPDLRHAVYGTTFTHSAKPSHDIVGVVKDKKTGKPIANVLLVGTADPSSRREPHFGNTVETTTDQQGRFRLTGLPKADQRFIHVKPGRNPYLDRLIEVKDIEGLKPVTQDIELDRGVIIEGKLIDKVTKKPVKGEAKYLPLTGNPIFQTDIDTRIYNDVFFNLHSTDTWADTDENGVFRLRVLPGSGVILARADVGRDPQAMYTKIVVAEADRKYLRKPNPDEISSTRPRNSKVPDRGHDEESFATGTMSWPLRWENGYAIINPEVKDDAEKVEIAFDPGKTLQAKVVDPDNKPLTDVDSIGTYATDEMKPTKLKTSPFKIYALDSKEKREIVLVHEAKKLVGTLVVGLGDKDPIVQLQPWATIKGRVVNPDGTPAVNAQVSFQFTDQITDGMIRQKLYRDKPRSSIRTDKEGRFEIDGMFPGEEVTIGANGAGLRFGTASNALMPLAGQVIEMGDLKLPKGRE